MILSMRGGIAKYNTIMCNGVTIIISKKEHLIVILANVSHNVQLSPVGDDK